MLVTDPPTLVFKYILFVFAKSCCQSEMTWNHKKCKPHETLLVFFEQKNDIIYFLYAVCFYLCKSRGNLSNFLFLMSEMSKQQARSCLPFNKTDKLDQNPPITTHWYNLLNPIKLMVGINSKSAIEHLGFFFNCSENFHLTIIRQQI